MNQLKLVLKVYDADGNTIPALSVDPATPQHLTSVLPFLSDGMRMEIGVESVTLHPVATN